jgi:hypothetical protein
MMDILSAEKDDAGSFFHALQAPGVNVKLGLTAEVAGSYRQM